MAETASYNCNSESLHPDEQVICNSEELSRLDSTLSELYSIALKRMLKRQKSELIETQRKWLSDRKILCDTNNDCIKQHYLKRIEQFEYLLSNTDYNFKLGTWERVPLKGFNTGLLHILLVDAIGFKFELHATSGGNAGLVEGRAKFQSSDQAVFHAVDYPCTLSFKWSNNFIIVTQKTCHCCGVGVTVNGKYTQDTLNVEHKFDAFKHMAMILGNDSINMTALNLLGKEYSRFASSFQLTYEETDVDTLGCAVIRGTVPGLSNFMQSIIMFDSTYNIYSAFIVHDTVKYFTTNAKYRNILPYTIEKWKGNFNTYPVISGLDGTPVKTKSQVAQDSANKKKKILIYGIYSICILAGLLIFYFILLWVTKLGKKGIIYLKNKIFVPQLICSAFLIFALNPDNPYGYYVLLRLICFSSFIYLAYKIIILGKHNWAYVLGSMALIYNPIIRVHLEREIWSIINIITILVLIPTIHLLPKNINKSEVLNNDSELMK